MCVTQQLWASQLSSFFQQTNPKSGGRAFRGFKNPSPQKRLEFFASWVPPPLCRKSSPVCLLHVCASSPPVNTFLQLPDLSVILRSLCCCLLRSRFFLPFNSLAGRENKPEWDPWTVYLSHCSIVVKRHHHQGNFYERKHRGLAYNFRGAPPPPGDLPIH